MKLEGNLRSVQLVAEELTWTLWRTALNRLDAFAKVKDAIWARDREVRAATLREAAGIFEDQHWAAHELNRMATETDGIAVDGFPVGPVALAAPSPETGAPTMYEGRIQDVASENFGTFPRQTDEEAMTAIERGIFEQRLTIERLTHPPAAPAAEPGKPATCEPWCGEKAKGALMFCSDACFEAHTGRATREIGWVEVHPFQAVWPQRLGASR